MSLPPWDFSHTPETGKIRHYPNTLNSIFCNLRGDEQGIGVLFQDTAGFWYNHSSAFPGNLGVTEYKLCDNGTETGAHFLLGLKNIFLSINY